MLAGLRISDRLERLWVLYREVGVAAEVARKLGVSRQAVSKGLSEFRKKLASIFYSLQEVYGCRVDRFDLVKGFMVCSLDGLRMYFFYIPGSGIRGIISCRGKLYGDIDTIAAHLADSGLTSHAGIRGVRDVLEKIENGKL